MNKQELFSVFFEEGMVDDVLAPYSGRYMLGQKCLAISCDNPAKTLMDIVKGYARYLRNNSTKDKVCIDNITHKIEEFCECLGDVRSDSLGMGQVIYWPKIEVTIEELTEAGILDNSIEGEDDY